MNYWKFLEKANCEERRRICNWCWTIKKYKWLFDFIFKASCQQHDFYYSRWWNFINKAKADWSFYKIMLYDIWNYNKIYKKPFYFIVASFYFLLVSLFWFRAFFWVNKRIKFFPFFDWRGFFKWKTQKTIKDILLRITRKKWHNIDFD